MNPPLKPRFSLVGRYSLLSLTLIVGAVAVLSSLYAAVADSVTERLAGERLEAQVAGTANRLTNFIENRIYQLETLSTHPSMPLYLNYTDAVPDGVRELVRVEADSPDLYGILFFNDGNELTEVVPGQAASGQPYWGRSGWGIQGLPLVMMANSEVIGPRIGDGASPGWLLIRQPLRETGEQPVSGSIALHVRLASLTELMRTENLAGTCGHRRANCWNPRVTAWTPFPRNCARVQRCCRGGASTTRWPPAISSARCAAPSSASTPWPG